MTQGRQKHIGLIFPGGGPEGEYYRFERRTGGAIRVYFANSRVGVDAEGRDHSPESLRETARIDWITEAAARIRPLELDVMMWACTSGSFIRGREFAEEQAASLAAFAGVPASSTSLAFVAAARSLGLRKVGVLATYPEAAARAFAEFLAAYGLTVDRVDWLGTQSGWDANLLADDSIERGARRVASSAVDAVLIPDTALAALHLVDALEAELGRPVITANAATLWQAQELAGAHVPVSGLGSLLA